MADTSISSRDKSRYPDPGEFATTAGVKEKTREEISALASKAKEGVSSTTEKTKNAGASVVQKVEGMASTAVEKTKEMASSAAEKIEGVASTVGHKAEEAVDTVGAGMKSVAGAIREKAPASGILADAASGIASGLDTGGSYLQEHNIHGMAKDVINLVRRYPLESILAVAGIGFLVGRASRSNHVN
jgi:phage-related protein